MGCYPAVSLLTCPRAHVRNACEGCTALQAHLGREGGHEGEQQRGQQEVGARQQGLHPRRRPLLALAAAALDDLQVQSASAGRAEGE